MERWHTLTPEETAQRLESSLRSGLTSAQARIRLRSWGPNQLAPPPSPSLLRRLSAQLQEPMTLVLIGAAALSYLASGGRDWLDSLIILLILLVNGLISILQEGQAERALESLRQLAPRRCRVIRGGSSMELAVDQLVPGDLVAVESGELVPADLRLIHSQGLRADESAITGESLPVDKDHQCLLAEDTPLAERENLLIGSTLIVAGSGLGIVTATGMHTEVGRIAALLLQQKRGDTPLQKRMKEISKLLSAACLGVCAVMFGIGLIQGRPLLDMLLVAVSLAVAAIPEGLPAVVTIVLALGVSRMAEEHAIVRQLSAVETLGCAGVICSDKTGTLTRNQMEVTQLWTSSGRGEDLLLSIGALCSSCRSDGQGDWIGDPTETALVRCAQQREVRKERLEAEFPQIDCLPFDSARKRMSTLHRSPSGGCRLMVKGAPELLLDRCTTVLDGGVRPMDAGARRRILAANGQMTQQALRVLGLAYRELEHPPAEGLTEREEQGLTFVGLAGMMDPPRPEARQSIAACRLAGIRTVMITGDHKETALAAARSLGILQRGSTALTGQELDAMSAAELEEQAAHCAVYARVTPEHKLRIVKALQAGGNITAMTGDGINDAPALKQADIGCAMGVSGTDAARQAADLVLTDDRFSTIVSAVRQGRGIYANIRKAIHYLLSCNIGELFALFAATVMNISQPLLVPVQLLWLNLVTDSLPALALGVEPVEDSVMTEPPRDGHAPLFDRQFTLRLLWQGLLIGSVTLAAYLLPGDPAQGNTMAFAALTLCQLFHAFDVRSESRTLRELGVWSNRAMDRAFCIGLLLQCGVLLVPPLQRSFSVVPLTGGQWAAVLLLSVLPVPVCEWLKVWRRGRRTERRREKPWK